MRPEDVPEIRRLALFRGMADAAFDALVRGAYLQSFPPAFELIREGDAADFLHVLVEGGVELFAGWSGRETTLAALAPVSTFVLAATITDRPTLMSARTIGKSRIALIPSEDVRRVFAADRAFAEAIVGELADRFRESVRHAKNVKLRSSVERLANYLLREHDAAGGAFALPHEKRLIAAWLGMTPENLSRAFGALRPYGVRVDGAQVELTEPDALRRLAKPTPLIDADG
jgi:CRP/FNR family transcriptional activator FtrB